MRLWHLPPSYLDRQRLQSQHYECEGLLTICASNRQWGSIAEQFRRSCHYIVKIHDGCAIEMGIRKGLTKDILKSHITPITADKLDPFFRSVDYKPSRAEYETDVIQLRNKWEREGYFFGYGRNDLRILERRLGLPEGRDYDDAQEQSLRTRQIVKDHKDFLSSIKGDKRLGDKLDELFSHLGTNLIERRYHAAE